MLAAVSAFAVEAPFKVIYSNDTTHIESCVSPYHGKGQLFTAGMLRASIDETAGTGVEVHMLQPGLGWVPWWQSTVYPDAYQWFMQTYNVTPDGFGQYMLSGGDMLAVFVERCRAKGLSPFVSYRLNDAHGKEWVDTTDGTVPSWAGHALSRFYKEHPEYRIGTNIDNWYKRVQNWAIPEVRQHKFDFIEEICRNYDIDGLELDFMRHCSLFNTSTTTVSQRKNIINGFISQVRSLLDETSIGEQHRWLCVRVPCYAEAFDALGIDLPAMVNAGVDMVNLSSFFFTDQNHDLSVIVSTIPDTPVYLEMTGCIVTIDSVSGGYDNYTYKRTTDEQFYTTAHLAYSGGAKGVSLFNFPYYREHGAPGRGPFNEPPFHIIQNLENREFLSHQNQHYILCALWDSPRLSDRQLPKTFSAGQTYSFNMRMAAPAGGWRLNAKLRIESRTSIAASSWQVKFNGHTLQECQNVAEPYANPYTAALGTAEQYKAWIVPWEFLAEGNNSLEIKMLSGGSSEIIFIDLAAAVSEPLAFELNASKPGDNVLEQWQPSIGTGEGTLTAVGTNGKKPKLMSEPDGKGGHIWFYRFEADTDGTAANTSGGYASGYGIQDFEGLKLDPRQGYSVEVWFRRSGLAGLPGNWGEHIIGNYNIANGTGWQMTTVGIGTGHTWARMQARMRDNTGTDKVDQGITSQSYNYAAQPEKWHHAVVVWKGGSPAGLVEGASFFDGAANFANYNNLTSPPAIPASYWQSDNLDVFGGEDVRIGAAYSNSTIPGQLWFRGDIALIRVYTYCLDEVAVSTLYESGPPVSAKPFGICTEPIDADVSGDCQVDFEDFAIVSSNWLKSNREDYFMWLGKVK